MTVASSLDLDAARARIQAAADKVAHVIRFRDVMPDGEAYVVIADAQIAIGEATKELEPAIAALDAATRLTPEIQTEAA